MARRFSRRSKRQSTSSGSRDKHSRRDRHGGKSRRQDDGAASGKRGRGRGRGGDAGPPRSGRGKAYVGRIQKNPRGFAFVLSEQPHVPDTYLSREDSVGLMNDDRVEYTIQRRGPRTLARIHKIVERGQTDILGRFSPAQGKRPALVASEHEAFRLDGPTKDLRDGDWVLARIEVYPTPDRAGRVRIREVLGDQLTPEHDIGIAIARFGLPARFSGEALKDADDGRRRAEAEFDALGSRSYRGTRRDLRDQPFVTIDGEDAKDFDDAVLVEVPAKGPAFVLKVAIADVSFFVRPGTTLDNEARNRGTSVYLPGTVVPMLPETLSNELCSLRPREDKLALVAEIHYDRDANVVGQSFYEAAIRTARRLTYAQVHRWNEGDVEVRRELSDLTRELESMRRLYERLNKQRYDRGVLDFDFPECKVQVDERGKPTRVGAVPRWASHKWIEEFMIAANQAVAKALREADIPTVHRVHETPDPASVDEINQLLKALGVGHVLKDDKPRDFARLLEATKSHKSAAALHQAILRRQKQARYEPFPKGHFGLALADYAHFTSPIRRYPDLMVHRALRQLIGAAKKTDKDLGKLPPLEVIAMENSAAERRAMEAERWVVRRKQCWFLLDRIDEVHEGRIRGVTAKGLFVEIPEFLIDGFVDIESLPGMYEFDEKRMALRRRPGHTLLTVGDPLKVRIVDVSIEDNAVTLDPVLES